MSDLGNAAYLFASRNSQKDASGAPSLGPIPAAFTLPYQKAPQRTLRKKRHVEEYQHYAAVVFDEDGSCHLLSSPSLKRQKRAILADAATRAQEVLEGTSGPSGDLTNFAPQSAALSEPHTGSAPLHGSISFPFDIKRRRLVRENPSFTTAGDLASVQLEETPNGDARGKASTLRRDIPFPSKLQVIRVDDTPAWRTWYTDGFTSIQQTACRTIAKEWIKAIHPKKQSTHPYNGKMPRCEGASPDPERTRPPYWPPHVRHKEPDHIDKTDRTTLLVHLLMQTPLDEIGPEKAKSEKSFTARDLLNALQKKQDEGIVAKWRIIEELVNAREAVENYEAGGIDGDAVLHVPDWGEVLRAAGSRKKGAGGSQAVQHIEEEGEYDYEASQAMTDESMGNEHADRRNSTQQAFQESGHPGSSGKVRRFPLSLNGGPGQEESQMTMTVQPQPPHASFQNAEINYHKPLIARDAGHHSVTTSALIQQQNASERLATFDRDRWRHDTSDRSVSTNGFDAIASFASSQPLADSTQYRPAPSLGQLPLGHQMITNPSYGGEGGYSYGMTQATNDGYGFHHLGQYQQLNYDPHYDMGRSFDGS